MTKTHKYKKIEKTFASNTKHLFFSSLKSIKSLALRIFKVLDSKLTIMVVPHTQGKVFNFQTNIFALSLGTLLLVGLLTSFFYFDHKIIGSGAEISKLTAQNRETQASLDELRDENINLLQAAKRFQSSLAQSFSLLGISENSSVTNNSLSKGDLSSLFTTKDNVSGSLREADDIRQFTSYLESVVQPVEQMGKMIENQNTLFKEIPSIWPLKNPNAHISMMFGPNIHPITGQWYIHKGVDFSTYRSGDPVIATANGQVVTVGYDPGYGNYVIIKHKHGIYTRYAHLLYATATKGQFVDQQDVIGYVGNTGVTTGPHLHYEVHVGSSVDDAAKYINIKLH